MPGNETEPIEALSLAVTVNVTVCVCADVLRSILFLSAPTEQVGSWS